eukprot:sb/3473534/
MIQSKSWALEPMRLEERQRRRIEERGDIIPKTVATVKVHRLVVAAADRNRKSSEHTFPTDSPHTCQANALTAASWIDEECQFVQIGLINCLFVRAVIYGMAAPIWPCLAPPTRSERTVKWGMAPPYRSGRARILGIPNKVVTCHCSLAE